MDDFIIVHISSSFHDLFYHLLRFSFTDFFIILFQVMLQVSFFTKLNNNVHIVCCLIDIIKTNNIFMRNFLHDFNLSFQILKVVCIHKDAFFDDFNSNFLVVGDINAQVDSSK